MSFDCFCMGDHNFPTEQHDLGDGGPTLTLVDTSSFPQAHVKFNNFTFGRLVRAMAELEALDRTSAPRGAEDVLSYQGVTGFIPFEKLSDNSGWRVSEQEAKATYDQIANQPLPESLHEDVAEDDRQWVEQVWREWVDFLGHTGEHNGFEVW